MHAFPMLVWHGNKVIERLSLAMAFKVGAIHGVLHYRSERKVFYQGSQALCDDAAPTAVFSIA